MSDMSFQNDDLGLLAEKTKPNERATRATARLKAKIYSALIRRQEECGPLLSLTKTREAGFGLCVFERLWEELPVGHAAKCFNCCSVCHARILGERVERAPIYWHECPYVAFGKK